MASKKCPKCGEDNPAEAVMCWACYTPLSGSAPLGAGLAGATAGAIPAAGAPVGVPPSNEAPAKKSIDPKVIGVGAFLLVGGLAAALMNGMLGGGGGDEGVAPPTDGTAVMAEPGGAPAPAAGGGVAPPPLTAPVAAAGAPVAPAPIPFKTIASPGGGYQTGTVGILVTGNAISPAGAAKFAKNQFARNGKWTNMQVAVFVDQTNADSFGTYQRNRKNAPLTPADFRSLADQGIWDGCPAFLDARGKSEKVYTPSRSPLSWWPGR